MKTIKSVGEFGLIDRIARRVKVGRGVVVGIGDDCAVLRYSKDKYLLVTTDMLIENVHFTLKAQPRKIGHKAIASSISDVAAMGGIPKYATISVGLRPEFSLGFVDGLFKGAIETAGKFGVDLIGGDTNRSGALIIDVTVIGEVKKENLALRSGARSGDIIFTTGELGGSIYSRHLSFTPRLREAQYLVRNFRVRSMIDISDGLSSDLRQICKSSDVGALIYEEAIPLSRRARSVENALNDGEDFELLFTLGINEARRLISRKPRWLKVTQIGEITDKECGIKIIGKGGRVRTLKARGFSHF